MTVHTSHSPRQHSHFESANQESSNYYNYATFYNNYYVLDSTPYLIGTVKLQ